MMKNTCKGLLRDWNEHVDEVPMEEGQEGEMELGIGKVMLVAEARMARIFHHENICFVYMLTTDT